MKLRKKKLKKGPKIKLKKNIYIYNKNSEKLTEKKNKKMLRLWK